MATTVPGRQTGTRADSERRVAEIAHHRTRTAAIAAVLSTACLTAGCATLGRVGEATLSALPLVGGRPTLYVVPPETMNTLPEGIPLVLRLRHKPWVRGTSLAPSPLAPSAVRVLRPPSKPGQPPDTATVERSLILVALSPEPTAVQAEPYTGKWPPPDPVTATQVVVGSFMVVVAAFSALVLGAYLFAGFP